MSNDIYTKNEIKEILSKIDISRLSRNYYEEPIYTSKNGQTSEFLTKEELKYLYIELNLRKEEICLFLHCNEIRLSRMLRRVNLKKERNLVYLNIQKGTNKKFGVDNISKLPEFRSKAYNTWKERTGYENPNMAPEVMQKRRNTCKIKYGVENPFQSKECNEKARKTKLDKYGVEWYTQTTIYNEKAHNTKMKNGTFGKSKEEDKIYELLKSKFDNVERQYNNILYSYNGKYFDCDFYIPELDLYIEYQGYGTHGNQSFNPKNPEHIKVVEEYKRRAEEINFKGHKKTQYLNFIEVWTHRDPLKRQVAKENGLNWIEFFNMKQFMDWFDNLD